MKLYSECCWEVAITHKPDSFGTNYYYCSSCGEPCDVLTIQEIEIIKEQRTEEMDVGNRAPTKE